MNKTLVVWWRYGKEHDPAAGEFRVNQPGVVSAHIYQKVTLGRAWPLADWRWWQVDDELLVERADMAGYAFGIDTRIYYLVRRGLAVIENIHFVGPSEHWTWYVHVADIFFDAARDCWIKQDLFADILVDRGGREMLVIDLDDVATALGPGAAHPAARQQRAAPDQRCRARDRERRFSIPRGAPRPGGVQTTGMVNLLSLQRL